MPAVVRRLLLVLLAALPLAACASKRARGAPEPRTYVVVQNQNWLDMNVYVVRSSQRIRLGTVSGSSTARLAIPSSLLFGPTPLSFLVDPIGGRSTSRSFEITVSPGDEVTLTIPPSM